MSSHLDYFRGNVARSPAPVVKVWLIVAHSCQPEVDQNWIPAVQGTQHHILQFDISVHYSKLVEICESFHQTPHYLPDLFQR